MNLAQLDQSLRQFSVHEHNYLDQLKSEFNLKDEQAVFDNFDMIQKKSHNAYTPSSVTHLNLFDFKKNSRFLNVTTHSHDYIEMNYVYSGRITQFVNGHELTLHRGDIIILDTQVQHSVLMPGPKDIMLAFRFSVKYFIENFFREFNADNLLGEFLLKSIYESQKYNRLLNFNINDESEIRNLLQLLIIEFIEGSEQAQSVENNYILAIFTLLQRKYKTEHFENELGEYLHQYKSISNYLESHYQTATLKEMGHEMGYSPAYLSNLIKRVIGRNFSDLLLEIRLKNALILLQGTNLSINSICEQCGFSNTSFFYRKFKIRYNCTPKKYRINNQISHR